MQAVWAQAEGVLGCRGDSGGAVCAVRIDRGCAFYGFVDAPAYNEAIAAKKGKPMRLLLLAAALACTPLAQAQAATLLAIPTATQHKASLSWTNTCPSTVSCSFQVYRAAGTCPTAGAVAWSLLSTTTANAQAYDDLAVTQGTQYSYEVVAQAPVVVNGVTQTQISGPSNCVTGTIPNGPSPATGATVTAS